MTPHFAGDGQLAGTITNMQGQRGPTAAKANVYNVGGTIRIGSVIGQRRNIRPPGTSSGPKFWAA